MRDLWKRSLFYRSVASSIAEAGQLLPILLAPALIRKRLPWTIRNREEENQS